MSGNKNVQIHGLSRALNDDRTAIASEAGNTVERYGSVEHSMTRLVVATDSVGEESATAADLAPG